MAGTDFWRKPAPIWLRALLGLLILPVIWAAFLLALSTVFPAAGGPPVVWAVLIGAALLGAVLSWFIVRRTSTRVAAIFTTLVGLAYAFVALAAIPSYQAYRTPPPAAVAETPPVFSEPSGGGGGAGGASSGEGSKAAGGTAGGAGSGMVGGGGGLYPGLQMPPVPVSPVLPTPTLPVPSPVPMPVPQPDVAAEHFVPAKPEPAETLPEFPWPPPKASASYVLPDEMLSGYETVGILVTDILAALERGGYVERSFYRTPPGGVALVTRLERINDDGSPVADERWPGGDENVDSTATLYAFLRGLFYANPGHYRVIVFVIQDLPFAQSPEQVSAKQAEAWLTSGANVLPADLADRPFAGGHCTVLVYEFASDGTKVHVVASKLTGKEHLEKAGVLTALDRAP